MAIFDYEAFVQAIEADIEAYGDRNFKSVTRDKWIDDEGKLALALVDNSFSIFINGKYDDDDEESLTSQIIELDVQFCLDAKHDNYLATLGHTEVTIRDVLGLSYAEIDSSFYNPEMELTHEGDKVRVAYNLKYIIRNQ